MCCLVRLHRLPPIPSRIFYSGFESVALVVGVFLSPDFAGGRRAPQSMVAENGEVSRWTKLFTAAFRLRSTLKSRIFEG
jgi:hypothetical protein